MTDWGPPPEYGDDLEPERPVKRVKLSLREHVKRILAEQPPVDLRAEVQAVLRELLAEPETRTKLQGPPGPPGQSVIGAGGGGTITAGGGPINSLAAGDNITITRSGGQATIAASGGGDPAVLVATQTLTANQIKNLNSSSVQLVAGVANTVLLPITGWVYLHAGATQYTGNGGTFTISIGDAGIYILTLSSTVVTSATDDFGYFGNLLGNTGGGNGFGAVGSIGQGLYLFMESGPPTLGDGTMDVTVVYAAHDVS